MRSDTGPVPTEFDPDRPGRPFFGSSFFVRPIPPKTEQSRYAPKLSLFDAVPFWLVPFRGPASVLSHRPKGSAKKEGKESVKFVDGLANVAGNRPQRPQFCGELLARPL